MITFKIPNIIDFQLYLDLVKEITHKLCISIDKINNVLIAYNTKTKIKIQINIIDFSYDKNIYNFEINIFTLLNEIKKFKKKRDIMFCCNLLNSNLELIDDSNINNI